MNSSVYIFGKFTQQYTQYPNEESTSELFKEFYRRSQVATQIVIHRDDNLVYYTYIRKLDDSKYIGLCVLVNGLMITELTPLFDMYEGVITNLVKHGYLVKFDDYGNLTPNTERLYMNREAVENVARSLTIGFNKLETSAQSLPPQNYGVNVETVQNFTINDNHNEIIKSSHTNGYTYIYKDNGYNTPKLDTYKNTLSRISNDNDRLKKDNAKLTQNLEKEKKRTKQVKLVNTLALILLCCGIGLAFVYNNLSNTQNELNDANSDIKSKTNIIKHQRDSISSITNQLNATESALFNERWQRESVEDSLRQMKESFSNILPIIVTNMEIANVDANDEIIAYYGNSIHGYNTMFLKPRIAYRGVLENESITLYGKLYNSFGDLSRFSYSPSDYTWSEVITVSEGDNNFIELKGHGGTEKGYWLSGTYRFEIWYKDVCLKAKTFKIY